ncbi:MAG: T9SS type A sorting domain-containing protein, partial [Paludibacter sp.]
NIPLIKISPNPVKDILILESINTDSPFTSVEVMDIMGKSVKTTLITNSSESKLDLSDCMTGIYYVLVKYKDKTEAHKIIKI